MVELSRVPGPRSPFDGRWGTLVGLVLVGFAIAIVKPWNMSSADPAQPIPFTTSPPAVAAEPTSPTVRYDPAGFGEEPPAPAWEIWAADGVTRIGFDVPPDEFSPPDGGPAIELGSSGRLGAFAVNTPRDVELAAVRLWRFTVGGEPERIELRELARPWPARHFRAFAPRGPSAPGVVPAWRPGIYRLDLLIDPLDRVRSLILIVTPEPGEPFEADVEPAPSQPLNVTLLRRLPDKATLWAFGSVLTGWSRDDGPETCGVAEIWRAAKDVDAPCHPIPLGRPVALGVNLPGRDSVASIRLSELDPLPGPVASIERTTVDGRAGVALVEVSSPGLTDGIYRLDVVTAAGRALRWYVEVGPDPLG
jgi:hypothetical protein